jgi:hypothetical protein
MGIQEAGGCRAIQSLNSQSLLENIRPTEGSCREWAAIEIPSTLLAQVGKRPNNRCRSLVGLKLNVRSVCANPTSGRELRSLWEFIPEMECSIQEVHQSLLA